MTDQQGSDIRSILGDIAAEASEPSSPSKTAKTQPSKGAAPRAGAAAAPQDSSRLAASLGGQHGHSAKAQAIEGNDPLGLQQKKTGFDWSALKGKLIRMPVVGRALRIGMAIIRLPKRLDAITDSISMLSDQNIDLETKLHSEISALQSRQQQLKLALETGKSDLGDSSESDLVGEYFHALAERFRGPYDQVKEKMAGYLPILAKESVDFRQYPAVDLACGRCEWADLLRDEGIHCVGVDANPIVLRPAKDKGLKTYCGDIFTYLESLADGSQGIVSGFHIIEHLPTAQKLKLFSEAHRVLVPGGLLILETPNSENPMVSSHYFYLDPSHLNPVPIPALEFMAEHFGFETAAIHRHSPMTHDGLIPETQSDTGAMPSAADKELGEADKELVAAEKEQGAAKPEQTTGQFVQSWISKEQDYGLVARKKPA